MPTRFLHPRVWGVLLLLAACGCATYKMPRFAHDAGEVDARRFADYPSDQVRLNLRPAQTGTGRHDFYYLFANDSGGPGSAPYGFRLFTPKTFDLASCRVTSDLPQALEALTRTRRTLPKFSPSFDSLQGTYIEAGFGGEFLAAGMGRGARVRVDSPSRTLEFEIPAWMFAALDQQANGPQRERLAREQAEEAGHRREVNDYLSRHPELPPGTRDSLYRREIRVGMTPEEVQLAWGPRDERVRTTTAEGVYETWSYGTSTLVHFFNGAVTAVETR